MNPLAEQGFARGAEAYARARPSYPPEALAWLREQLGLSATSAVLDLGAGTGKLTAQLTGLGRVIAVEPVAEMRAELAKLPPLSADRASVIETSRAFAAIFLPRARRLASDIGMAWPTDFEEATRRHLKRGLGLEI